jgi:hypothetical protein
MSLNFFFIKLGFNILWIHVFFILMTKINHVNVFSNILLYNSFIYLSNKPILFLKSLGIYYIEFHNKYRKVFIITTYT